ncbi:outer membrane protein [Legionella sp. km772]|uniref:outer membrane protein n=1 Tax=Legionella sp. km772 TaxID=2498111 RepID=UPI0013157076|nr:outer membrane beta-barrel protein [Legionella sp. km772]
MIIKGYKKTSVGLGMLLTKLVFAGSMGALPSAPLSNGLFIKFFAGPAWTVNTDDIQQFGVGASTYTYYTNTEKRKTVWGAALGKEFNVSSQKIQFDLAYYHYGAFSKSGQLVQGADAASSDVFPYQYEASIQQLLLEAKILSTFRTVMHPYAQLGLGIGFNKTQNYGVTVPDFLTFSPLYANRSQTNLAYNLGAGIDFDVTAHLRAGIGYLFSDSGKVALGNGLIDDVPITPTLKQQHFYTNTLLLQINYII